MKKLLLMVMLMASVGESWANTILFHVYNEATPGGGALSSGYTYTLGCSPQDDTYLEYLVNPNSTGGGVTSSAISAGGAVKFKITGTNIRNAGNFYCQAYVNNSAYTVGPVLVDFDWSGNASYAVLGMADINHPPVPPPSPDVYTGFEE